MFILEIGDFEEEPASVALCVAVNSQEEIVFISTQRNHKIQVSALEIGVEAKFLFACCGIDAIEESVFSRTCRVILLLLITCK